MNGSNVPKQPTIPPMPKRLKLRLIDILRKMDEDELAEWLCVQMWDDYREDLSLKAIRFHQVRNFLLMEVDNENQTG